MGAARQYSGARCGESPGKVGQLVAQQLCYPEVMSAPRKSKNRADTAVVSAAYAKANLGELLKTVQRGQVVTIERYNKPVAILSPPLPPERRVPKFGTVRGAKILDPHWAEPMTEEEVDQMLKDRY